jgi:hypothetical protein
MASKIYFHCAREPQQRVFDIPRRQGTDRNPQLISVCEFEKGGFSRAPHLHATFSRLSYANSHAKLYKLCATLTLRKVKKNCVKQLLEEYEQN